MNSLLEKIAHFKVLVIGDLMLDHYIWGEAHRLSPEAPVPVLKVKRDTYAAGGAANVALNIIALGGQCELCGWIGKDDAGQQLVSILHQNRVTYDPQFCTTAVSTIQKTRIMAQHHQLGRVDREAAPSAYRFDSAAIITTLKRKMQSVDAVILSDYAKGVLSEPLITALQKAAKEQGCCLALDPRPKRPLQSLDLDLLTPNQDEALLMAEIRIATGEPFPAEAVCRRIWERHRPKLLVVTLGPEGMLISTEGHVVQHVPTAAREVFDVSGAGDTVIAALTLALATGASPQEASRLANLAAGIVVGKRGTATAAAKDIIRYAAKAKPS